MCGIAGFSINPGSKIDAQRLAAALLEQIIQRGQDATGVGWTAPDGTVFYAKAPIDAFEFIEDAIHQIDPDSKTVVLHTRYATKGSPEDNDNNHPIIRPGIVGVHNGVITNDDEIFDILRAERVGVVDSEAAFALLSDCELHATESLALLDGRVALGWIETERPDDLHIARWSGSPLAWGQTTTGSFVFASTLPLLQAAGRKAGLKFTLTENLPEGWYLRVRGGRVHDCLPIGAPARVGKRYAKVA